MNSLHLLTFTCACGTLTWVVRLLGTATPPGGTRNFYDKTGVADTPVDKKPYNMLPEHFETVHYQDFNYVASKGPFGLAMK